MCGFVGTLTDNRLISNRIYKASDFLSHRGPDESKIYSIDNLHIGFRRLAIIDIATGSQPISKGDYVIVFNGEIYNFKELKDELVKEGYQFNTKGDTEVILSLFIKHSSNTVKYLNGIFSIAIYNKKNKELFLCRDHTGVKPLFYSHGDFGITFASEINALKYLLDKSTLNKEILYHYLSTLYIPAPWTIYNEIKSLEPGCYLRYKDNKIEYKQYWKFDFKDNLRYDEAKEKLKDAIDRSVKEQLISERPLGVLLSGGIDSSLITLSVSKYINPKTFTIVVRHKDFNEQEYARQISKKVNSIHSEIEIPKIDLNLLKEIVPKYGQPFADTSLLPTYLLSGLISQYITVALAGDGGDDLFCGYEHKYLSSDKENFFERYYFRVSEVFKREFLLKSFYQESTYKKFLRHIKVDPSLPVNRLIRLFDCRYFLEGDILQKVDISSMAHSVEVRVPLLSQNILELSTNMSEQLLIEGRCVKKILKDILCESMPYNFVHRPKVGLNLPIRQWIQEIADSLSKTLYNEPICELSIFNLDKLLKLFKQKKYKSEAANLIFAIYVLNIWLKKQ